jgi:hypothetical protein
LLEQYPNGTYADFCAKQKSSEENKINPGEDSKAFATSGGPETASGLAGVIEDGENDKGV